MECMYYDYGYANKLGQFFIPRVMQQNSRISSYKDDIITVLTCFVEDNYIVIAFHDAIEMDNYGDFKESKKRVKDKEKIICILDELGRIIIPKKILKQLRMCVTTALKIYLIDECTIKIECLGKVVDCIAKLRNKTITSDYLPCLGRD